MTASAPAPARVLLVDDNEANRFAVGYWLRTAGYAVDEVGTGAEALARAVGTPDREAPDLVVLDIRLPDMSGFEVLRALRAGRETADIPVLHLTASFVTGEWRAHGLDAGADGYLTHPVEPHEFVATVRALLRARAAESAREALLVAERAARADADRERLEAERARAAAERANRAKAEFLATMSHELRTPLNAIGGYAELLALGITGPVSDAQRAQLERIQASQRHLLGLVNEVLDLAKIDANAVPVARVPVVAGDTVDAALALVRPQAAAKHLALSESCGDAAHTQYLGDEPRIRQILVNLLGNAVKFTPAGGRIDVACAVGGVPPAVLPAASGPYLALRVQDSGVGIAADERERIFEPFTQAGTGSNPYTRAVGGTGLGLTISRRFARLMGGDLTVDSTLGAGSTFTLWLPMVERRKQPRGDAAGEASDAAMSGAETGGGSAVDENGAGDSAAQDGEDRVEDAALARLSDAVLAGVPAVIRAWVERLRADAAIPDEARDGRRLTNAELEDHAATFVTDVALAVRVLANGGADTAALMRDGTAILGTVAERHGAQRARLGWPAAALTREFALLRDVLVAAVGAAGADAGPGSVARAREAVTHLLTQATRVSVGGFRVAGGGEANAAAQAPVA